MRRAILTLCTGAACQLGAVSTWLTNSAAMTPPLDSDEATISVELRDQWGTIAEATAPSPIANRNTADDTEVKPETADSVYEVDIECTPEGADDAPAIAGLDAGISEQMIDAILVSIPDVAPLDADPSQPFGDKAVSLAAGLESEIVETAMLTADTSAPESAMSTAEVQAFFDKYTKKLLVYKTLDSTTKGALAADLRKVLRLPESISMEIVVGAKLGSAIYKSVDPSPELRYVFVRLTSKTGGKLEVRLRRDGYIGLGPKNATTEPNFMIVESVTEIKVP